MTSNMIYIVAFGVGLKCPSKIHLNTQCGGGVDSSPPPWFLASEASESLVLNMTFDGFIVKDFFEMFNFSLAQNLTIY